MTAIMNCTAGGDDGGLRAAERPDRPCDPGCSRRLHSAAECDCTRSQSAPLSRGFCMDATAPEASGGQDPQQVGMGPI